MADTAIFADAYMGVREKVVSDFCAAINGNETVQYGILADSRLRRRSSRAPRVGAVADLRCFRDEAVG